MANSKINAFLVHLGFNMWLDQPEKDGIHALPGKGRISVRVRYSAV